MPKFAIRPPPILAQDAVKRDEVGRFSGTGTIAPAGVSVNHHRKMRDYHEKQSIAHYGAAKSASGPSAGLHRKAGDHHMQAHYAHVTAVQVHEFGSGKDKYFSKMETGKRAEVASAKANKATRRAGSP